MAISTEVEVLRQQLKGKGVYPAPPNYTHITQQNVHFRPIQPANLSPLQHQDRLFFDPLLSTRTGSTGSQSDGVSDPTQGCHSTSPTVHTPSPRMPGPAIPPKPYVNQAAVEQHMRTQSPSVPPRNLATVAAPPKESPETSVAEEPLITLATSQQTPHQVQKRLTRSPQQPKKSKSKDGQGVKQSKNINPTDTAPVCWRCGEPGHKKRDCRKQPFCRKCRKEGHVPALCPLGKGPTPPSQLQQQADKFSIPANRCIHCGGAHVPNSCPVRYQPKAASGSSNYGSPKQNTRDNNVASAQVRGNQSRQVSPLVQQNTFAQPIHSNSFPPHPYFPIPFPPPPVPPSNASVAPSAPASDLSAAISLMTNAVNQGNANMTNITDALQRTTKTTPKVQINSATSFKEMLLLCARQAVRDFILDGSRHHRWQTNCERLWLHQGRIHRGRGNVRTFRQYQPGRCSSPQSPGHSQLEDTREIHIRNPNYKGKNYDPNYQARKAENKQQEQLTMTNNQYEPNNYYTDVNSTNTHFIDTCTVAVGPATGTVFPISCNSTNNLNIKALYDTGASMSCMSLKTFDSLKLNLTKERFPLVVTATGSSMDPIGFTECTFFINGYPLCKNLSFVLIKLNLSF